MIGRITPIDVMRSEFALRYSATKGKQIPERFEGGLKDTLVSTLTPLVPPSPPVTEPTVLKTHGEKLYAEVENGEPLEIKAK